METNKTPAAADADASAHPPRNVSGMFSRSSVCIPLFLILFFVTALLWAKARDPFRRIEFSFKSSGGTRVAGVAVLPKGPGPFPVAVMLDGSRGKVFVRGNELRLIAEQQIAAVGLEYDPANQAAFDDQFIALQHYLSRQRWVRSNATAWIGCGPGARRELSFLFRHPEYQPQLLVRFSGGGVDELNDAGMNRLSTNLHVLLVHGEEDQVFPAADSRRLAVFLETNQVPVDVRVFPGQSHGFGMARPMIVRGIGEYCAAFFGRLQPGPLNVRPSYFVYWLPIGALAAAWWSRKLWRPPAAGRVCAIPRGRWGGAIVWLALLLAAAALAETAVHLGLPRVRASSGGMSLARRWIVPARLQNDFDWLASRPRTPETKISVLLEHLQLADLQRKFFYPDLNEDVYRNFILSPAISGEAAGDLPWRRALWENFYPRIRHETDPVSAAQSVIHFLRERVTVANGRTDNFEIETIWQRELADVNGFERIYVAALRSVGIAARLNEGRKTELLAQGNWEPAPRPMISSFVPRK